MVLKLKYSIRTTKADNMNFNNYTIKSQEAIQNAQQIVQSNGQQQIENEHLFKGILNVDENVLPFILKKLKVHFLLSSLQLRFQFLQ